MSCFPLLLLAGLLAPAPHPTAPVPDRPHFPGAGGTELPFASDAEVLEFLREARVVSSERAPGGVTGARKLLLERDGVRAHAIHPRVEVSEPRHVYQGRFVPDYRDHHVHEVAAYHLATALGLQTVPPTVPRRIQGTDGSLQLWIQDAVTGSAYAEQPRPTLERVRQGLQLDQMRVFDNLAYNVEIDALLVRRRLLVEALRARLEREGPRQVLFDLASWSRPGS